MKKRILAGLLSVAMMVTSVQLPVLAAENGEQGTAVTMTQEAESSSVPEQQFGEAGRQYATEIEATPSAPISQGTPTPVSWDTPTPTATPAMTPTPTLAPAPTATPVATPTATPTGTPTPVPTATPTFVPAPQPTTTPTATATPFGMATPSAVPLATGTPTATPTGTPTVTPSATPASEEYLWEQTEVLERGYLNARVTFSLSLPASYQGELSELQMEAVGDQDVKYASPELEQSEIADGRAQFTWIVPLPAEGEIVYTPQVTVGGETLYGDPVTLVRQESPVVETSWSCYNGYITVCADLAQTYEVDAGYYYDLSYRMKGEEQYAGYLKSVTYDEQAIFPLGTTTGNGGVFQEDAEYEFYVAVSRQGDTAVATSEMDTFVPTSADSVGINLAPVYYRNADQYPLVIQLLMIEQNADYFLTYSIDGKETQEEAFFVTGESNVYQTNYYHVIHNLGAIEEGAHSISVTVRRGDRNGAIIGRYATGFYYNTEEIYMDKQVTGSDTYSFSANIYDNSDKLIQKTELVDQQGTVWGKGQIQYRYSQGTYDTRYDDYFENFYELQYTGYKYSMSFRLASALSNGVYDCKVTYTDGSIVSLEDVYEVNREVPIVTGTYGGNSGTTYINQSDAYIPFILLGANLDPARITPVLRKKDYRGIYRDVTAGAEFIRAYSYNGNMAYEYRLKIGDMVLPEYDQYQWDIVAADGYSVEIDPALSRTFWLARKTFTVSDIAYNGNYRAAPYYIYLYGDYQGTVRAEISILDFNRESMGTGSVTVDGISEEGTLVRFNFNMTGNYALSFDRPYYEKVTLYDTEGNVIGTSDTDYDLKYIKWHQTKSDMTIDMPVTYAVGTREIPLKWKLEEDAEIDRMATYRAYLLSSRTSQQGTPEKYLGTPVEMTVSGNTMTGTWTSSTGLEAGTYWMTLYQGETLWTSCVIYVPDALYMPYMMNASSGSNVQILATIPGLELKIKEKYGEDFTDDEALTVAQEELQVISHTMFGDPIEGVSLTGVESRKGAQFLFDLEGPFGQNHYTYFKLVDKNGNDLLYEPGSDTTYCAMMEAQGNTLFSARYGSCNPINTGDVVLYQNNAIIGFTAAGAYTYPLTVNICDPGTKGNSVLKSFEVEETQLSNNNYYLKINDLAGLDLKEVYRINVLDQNQTQVISQEGLLSVRGSSITVKPGTVYLAAGASRKVQISALEYETVSENEAVATVDGNQITATGKGSTSIRVNLAGQEENSASCQVYVGDINKKEILLDKGERAALQIASADEEGKDLPWEASWSSSDASVASVDSQGNVTATGVGYAVITGVSRGFTFQCEVTVEIAVKSISLNHKELSLKPGESAEIAVILLPVSTTLDPESGLTLELTDAVTGEPAGDAFLTMKYKGKGVYLMTAGCEAQGQALLTVRAQNYPEVAPAQLAITVEPELPLPGSATEGSLLALGNTETRLADLNEDLKTLFGITEESREESVEWKDETLAIGTLQGVHTFAVIYHKGNRSVETTVPVKIASITGIEIDADRTTLYSSYYDSGLIAGKTGDLNMAYLTGRPVFNVSLTDTEKEALLTRVRWGYQVKKGAAYVDSSDLSGVEGYQPEIANAIYPVAIQALSRGSVTVEMYLADRNVAGESVSVNATVKKLASASVNLTVKEQAPVRIGMSLTDTETGEEITCDDSGVYYLPAGTASFILNAWFAEFGYEGQFTFASSASRVLSVGKEIKQSEGEYRIPVYSTEITVKGGGFAELTVTDKKNKSNKATVTICAGENAVTLRESEVTINRASDEKYAYIHLDPSDGAMIFDGEEREVVTAGNSKLKITPVQEEAPNVYKVELNLAKGEKYAGSYSAALSFTGENAAVPINGTLKVKVVNKAPSVTVKATAIDTFYECIWNQVEPAEGQEPVKGYGNGALSISTGEMVTRVVLGAGCDKRVQLSPDGGTLFVTDPAGILGKKTKVTLKVPIEITCEGYEPITKTVSVAVTGTAPTLTYTKTLTVYEGKGLNAASTWVTDKAAKEIIDLSDPNWSIEQSEADSAAYRAEVDASGALKLVRNAGVTPNYKKGDKITIAIKNGAWSRAVPVTITVKTNTKATAAPKAKLSKTSLDLNLNQEFAGVQQYETVLEVTGVSYDEIRKITVTPVNALSEEMMECLYFDTNVGDGTVNIRIADPAKLAQKKNKSLSYQITAAIGAADEEQKNEEEGTVGTNGSNTQTVKVSAKLTLKLKETVTTKTVTVKTKGTIDILNRAVSVMEISPKLTGLTGTVTDVKLTGRDAHLFTAEMEDGVPVIRAREDVSYLTRYNYVVRPVYTIDNGYLTYQAQSAADLKFKIKQGTLKKPGNQTMNVSGKSTDVFYTGTLNFTNSTGEPLPIASVELIAPKGMDGVLELTELSYDERSTCTYTICPAAALQKKLVKGRKYSYSLEVRLKDTATNEKPVKIKLTVTVK